MRIKRQSMRLATGLAIRCAARRAPAFALGIIQGLQAKAANHDTLRIRRRRKQALEKLQVFL